MLSLQLCFWAHFFGQLDGHSRKLGLQFNSSKHWQHWLNVSSHYYVHYCFRWLLCALMFPMIMYIIVSSDYDLAPYSTDSMFPVIIIYIIVSGDYHALAPYLQQSLLCTLLFPVIIMCINVSNNCVHYCFQWLSSSRSLQHWLNGLQKVPKWQK